MVDPTCKPSGALLTQDDEKQLKDHEAQRAEQQWEDYYRLIRFKRGYNATAHEAQAASSAG
eukprot:2423027-Pyramimonas_sp.AAC.1